MEIEAEQKAKKSARGLPAWVVVAAFVVLLGFLALIAWGLNRAQSGPITVGEKVPPFQMTTFSGEQISTADHTDKVIVVNFWASWCKPCEQEALDMQKAWENYQPGGKVLFIGLDYVDTEPEAMEFINRYGITYPNGPDLRTTVSQMFRIQGVPETYVINTSGELVYVKKGPFLSLNEIQGVIEQALASN